MYTLTTTFDAATTINKFIIHELSVLQLCTPFVNSLYFLFHFDLFFFVFLIIFIRNNNKTHGDCMREYMYGSCLMLLFISCRITSACSFTSTTNCLKRISAEILKQIYTGEKTLYNNIYFWKFIFIFGDKLRWIHGTSQWNMLFFYFFCFGTIIHFAFCTFLFYISILLSELILAISSHSIFST